MYMYPTNYDQAAIKGTKETLLAIEWLERKGIYYTQPSQWQIKIGQLNYYPGKGTIYIDGEMRVLRQKGLSGLQELLSTGKGRA